MEGRHLEKKHLWLKAYLASASYDVPVATQYVMRRLGVDLLDIDQVVESGDVLWENTEYDVSHFAVIGRNCDDQCFKVFGWFEAVTMTFTICNLEKVEG